MTKVFGWSGVAVLVAASISQMANAATVGSHRELRELAVGTRIVVLAAIPVGAQGAALHYHEGRTGHTHATECRISAGTAGDSITEIQPQEELVLVQHRPEDFQYAHGFIFRMRSGRKGTIRCIWYDESDAMNPHHRPPTVLQILDAFGSERVRVVPPANAAASGGRR